MDHDATSKRSAWIIGPFIRVVLLLFLVLFVSLIAVLSVPHRSFSTSSLEAVLRTNLDSIREGIELHTRAYGRGPYTLDELVKKGYFREVPVDPMVLYDEEWRVVRNDRGEIKNVFSASHRVALDGTVYGEW